MSIDVRYVYEDGKFWTRSQKENIIQKLEENIGLLDYSGNCQPKIYITLMCG